MIRMWLVGPGVGTGVGASGGIPTQTNHSLVLALSTCRPEDLTVHFDTDWPVRSTVVLAIHDQSIPRPSRHHQRCSPVWQTRESSGTDPLIKIVIASGAAGQEHIVCSEAETALGYTASLSPEISHDPASIPKDVSDFTVANSFADSAFASFM